MALAIRGAIGAHLRLAVAVMAALLPGSCRALPGSALYASTTAPSIEMVGRGHPSVVFESGLGSGDETWTPVLGKIAEHTTTYAYSRPGYNGTPLAPYDADGKRDAREVAVALHERLIASKVPGPYILVGHSLGGLYVLQFAKLYPRDVAGIVLVDGRMPGFVRLCARAGAPCANPGPAEAGSPAQIVAEVNGLAASESEAPSPASLGNIPVTLLTRGIGKSDFLKIWQASQDAFAAGLRNGRHVVAARSEHYIQQDEPDLVVAEIERMIATVKGGGKARAR